MLSKEDNVQSFGMNSWVARHRSNYDELIHPKNVKEKAGMTDAEKPARIEIFKQYWFELEGIRKGAGKNPILQSPPVLIASAK